MALFGDGFLGRKKSRKIKLSKTGNPTSRPFFSRLWGMATAFIVTLALVGVVIFIRKTFPDGSKSSFDPTSGSLHVRQDEPVVGELVAKQNDERAIALPSFPPITIPPIHVESTVVCSTRIIPAKKAKRGAMTYTTCSTSYWLVAPTTTSSPRRFTLAPPRFTGSFIIPTLRLPPTPTSSVPPPPTSDPCILTTSRCEIIRKRQEICSTWMTSLDDCGTTSTTPPPSSSTDRCVSTSVNCPFHPAFFAPCVTSFITAESCYSSNTTSSVPTSTSSVPITSSTSTTRDIDSPPSTSTSSIPSTTSTASSTSTSSVDPCITTWVDCSLRWKRDGSDGCPTLTSTFSSCLPTVTPSSSNSSIPVVSSTTFSSTTPPTNSCVATSVSCTTIQIIARGGKRANRVDCSTSFSTVQECLTTSTTTATSESSTSLTSESSSSTLSEPSTSTTVESSTSRTSSTGSSVPLTLPPLSTSPPPTSPPPSSSPIPPSTLIFSNSSTSIPSSSPTVISSSSSTVVTIPPTPPVPSEPPSISCAFISVECVTTTVDPIIFRERRDIVTSCSTVCYTPSFSVSVASNISSTSTTLSSTPSTTSTVPSVTLSSSSTVSSSLSTSFSFSTPSVTVLSSTSGSSISEPPSTAQSSTTPIPSSSESTTQSQSSVSSTSVIVLTPSLSSTTLSSSEPGSSTQPRGAETTSTASHSIVSVPSTAPATSGSSATSSGSVPSQSSTQSVSSDLPLVAESVSVSTASASVSSPPASAVLSQSSARLSITSGVSSAPQSSAQVPSSTGVTSARETSATVSNSVTSDLSQSSASVTVSSSGLYSHSTSSDEPTAVLQSAEESVGSATIIVAGGGPTGSATPRPTGGTSSPSGDLVSWPSWTIPESIVGNHVPVIAGRGVMLLLAAFYNQQLTHEPVRKLTTSGGISGSELAGGASFGASHIGFIAAQIGTAFSAGVITVDTNYCDLSASPTNLNPCPPRLSYTPWVVDVLICVLGVQAIVIAYSIAKWFHRPGGLSADPTTIAGVGLVMGHPEVERLFAGLPGEMTKSELKDALKDQQFRLGTFTVHESGVTKFGIMPVPWQDRKKQGKVGAALSALKPNITIFRSWQHSRLFFDLLFAAFLLALLGITLAAVASVDRPNTIFLSSAAAASGVGWKIFFAVLGIAVSFYWGRLFQDTQTFTPYFPLRRGEAPPSPTILLNRHTSPLCAILPLLRNRHLAAASVALTGLVAEFLIICLSGLPYRPGQLRSEFLFCGVASAAILSLMLAQLVAVAIWQRQGLPHLPRRPDTIGAVMTYVAGTSMVRDFQGLESLGTKERNKRIREMGKVYAYGWRAEEGGKVRWIVDEVPDAERKSFLTAGERESTVGGTGRRSSVSRYSGGGQLEGGGGRAV
ncbi:hypothetical protein B0H63DRAFT_3063 [Podospora didyma]|uniref:Uncharacterized protein n=1 Tax=Podospora didyma TaxID=330526 RepID=A0AAE0U6K7_9PEZI|nr:hypothetical protein B0H63DRAFT_3063 [Podospora didyma]